MFYIAYLLRDRADAARAGSAASGRRPEHGLLLARPLGHARSTSLAVAYGACSWRSTSSGRAQSIYNAVEPFHWYCQWGGVLFIGVVMIGGSIYYFAVQRHKTGTLAEHARRRADLAPALAAVPSDREEHAWRSSTTSSPAAGRRVRRRRAAVRGPERHGLPARGRDRPTSTTRRSCGSRTGCSCSTPATTGTTWSSRRRRATASCATPARRCSAAARRTTRASRSGRRARTSTSGRRWAARAGARDGRAGR